MPYVERDGDNYVSGTYAVKQPGYAEEWLDDGHPALSAKRPEVVAKENEIAALKQLRVEAKATKMFSELENASLSQIDGWVDNNFAGMKATQLAFLKLLAAVAGMYLREK